MQIVIDVSKDVYRRLKAGDTNAGNTFHNTALEAIGNGTPLPEGHGRLIDAGKIQLENVDFDIYSDYCKAFNAIDQADTIIEPYKAESEEV